MKQIAIAIMAISVIGGMMYADTTPGTTVTPTQPGQPTTTAPIIPIILRKTTPSEMRPAPSKGIEGEIYLTGTQMWINIGLSNYPMFVEVESTGSNDGYWSGVMTDESSCSIDFDGNTGEYEITITDAGNGIYTGYFTLE